MTQETRTGSTRITNPFVPGIGERPPHLGERPEVDAVFETTLEILREPRSPKARYIYMYGPRGTGRTVLLNALRRTVRTRPDPDILLQLSVNAVATEAGMRKVLLRPTIEMTGDQPETGVSVLATSESLDKAHEWARSWLRRFRLPQAELVRDIEGLQPTEMRFNVGLGSLTLTMPDRPGRSEAESLLRLGGPTLITLDEAHMVAPASLRILLNAVQEVGERMPVALVLAGTPDLKDVLHETQASFWIRGQKLPIGRLNAAAAYDVIAQPLATAGMTAEPDAVQHLAQKTDRYSFFLQLYGQEAFEAVRASGSLHFGPTECTAAVDATRLRRDAFYAELHDEFRPAGERRMALDVASAFKNHDGSLHDAQLEDVLKRFGTKRWLAREQFLRHKGFIWERPERGYGSRAFRPSWIT